MSFTLTSKHFNLYKFHSCWVSLVLLIQRTFFYLSLKVEQNIHVHRVYLTWLPGQGDERLPHGVEDGEVALAAGAEHVVGVEPEEGGPAESAEQDVLALLDKDKIISVGRRTLFQKPDPGILFIIIKT
jgi:hypothetical protein